MIDEILLCAGPGESRFALIEDGRAVEFLIDRGEGWPGDIALGRVARVEAGPKLAFVDIGQPRLGVMPARADTPEGSVVPVQLTAAARLEKGAELTRAVTLEGRFSIWTPTRPGLSLSRRLTGPERDRLRAVVAPWLASGEGAMIRTEAAGIDPAALLAMLEGQRRQWREISSRVASPSQPAPLWLHAPGMLARLRERLGDVPVLVDEAAAKAEAGHHFSAVTVWRDGPLFARHDTDEAWEGALRPALPLPGGGRLLFGVAAGLNVVDIDSGAGDAEETNRAALPVLARQLRLRGLSGRILVDPVGMAERRLVAAMAADLALMVADDPVPTQILGVTPSGLIELTRRREGSSLAETFLETPLPAANAASRALEGLARLVADSLARPSAKLALALDPAALAELERRPGALAEAARRLGRMPALAVRMEGSGYEIREV